MLCAFHLDLGYAFQGVPLPAVPLDSTTPRIAAPPGYIRGVVLSGGAAIRGAVLSGGVLSGGLLASTQAQPCKSAARGAESVVGSSS